MNTHSPCDDDKIHSRSVTLSSDTHGVIAKMDLIDAAAGAGAAGEIRDYPVFVTG